MKHALAQLMYTMMYDGMRLEDNGVKLGQLAKANLRTFIIDEVMKLYTEEELEYMLDYYDTPLGRSILDKQENLNGIIHAGLMQALEQDKYVTPLDEVGV